MAVLEGSLGRVLRPQSLRCVKLATCERMEAVSEPETLWRVEVAADSFVLLYLVSWIIGWMGARQGGTVT